MESAAIPRHSHLLILLHYGILSFRSVKEKRSRKESVATQVPWSFKSWGLHRLHLRWVSPDSLLSESLVFSVSHIKNTYSCQDLIALPDEEIRFPYYMSIFERGTTIRLTRAHNDRLTIKSFAWSSKTHTGFTFSSAKGYWHLDVMRNCCHEHKGNWSYTIRWHFHYIYSSSLLGYFPTRSTRVSVIYTWKKETQNSGLWNQ